MSLGEITCKEGAATVNCFCLEQSAAVTCYFAWKNGDLSANTCQAVAKLEKVCHKLLDNLQSKSGTD